MKISSLLESTNTKSYLYEGLSRQDINSVKLWENAGQYIAEANLTANQIQQLFQQIEQGSTASGTNRTALGVGKDAAVAVKNAYNDLKTKIETSRPMKNADAMYDKAAEKLKQATGGDQGVMKYVQKYRDFAKKHPIAQSVIYSALIAAAGISGAGAGGAAALGLLKMTDKLLQGEKFSKAAVAGAETGALAYGASKVADLFRGEPPAPDASTSGLTQGLNSEQVDYLKNIGNQGGTAIVKNNQLWVQAQDGTLQMLTPPHGVDPNAMLQIVNNATTQQESIIAGIALSEVQISTVFNVALLHEGVWDTVKSKAKTIGHNLTTKVTADKLNTAWKKAGSPVDSGDIANILQQQGVPQTVINQAFSALKIPVSKTKEPSSAKQSTNVKTVMAAINSLNKQQLQAVYSRLQKDLGTA